MLGVLFVLAFPGLALAADAPAAGGWLAPFTVIAAPSAWRSPPACADWGRVGPWPRRRGDGAAAGARPRVSSWPWIIGLALIESLAIYTLVIALILLFVKGINFA